MTTAIQTTYKGYRFRSRTEARWAVFFDALGVKWEYEHQGYSLPSGPYLPDFWFPEWNAFGEVKGTEGAFDARCLALAGELVEQTGQPLVMLSGTPELTMYEALRISEGDGAPRMVIREFVHLERSKETGRLWWWYRGDPTTCTALLRDAVDAARSARFEHGEAPQLPKKPEERPPRRPPRDEQEAASYAISDRMEEIDRSIAAATSDEKEALIIEKMDLADQLRTMGRRRWKEFR